MAANQQWEEFVRYRWAITNRISPSMRYNPIHNTRIANLVQASLPIVRLIIHVMHSTTNDHLFDITALETDFVRQTLQTIAVTYAQHRRAVPTYAIRMFSPDGEEMTDLDAIIAWYGLSRFTPARNRSISIEFLNAAPPRPIREPDITIHINNLNNTRIRRTGSFQQDLAQTRTIIDLQINPTATITDVYREVADRLFDDRHDISKIVLFNTRRMMLPANSTLRDNHIGNGEIIYLWQSNAGDPPDYYPGAYAR